jgi:hypothetical protein
MNRNHIRCLLNARVGDELLFHLPGDEEPRLHKIISHCFIYVGLDDYYPAVKWLDTKYVVYGSNVMPTLIKKKQK